MARQAAARRPTAEEDPQPMSATETPDTPPPSRGRSLLRLSLVAAAAAVLVWIGRDAAEHLTAFARWVEGFGAWAPLLFILGYALAVAALLPGSVLTIAGGALFGLAAGTVYAFAAAVLGSTLGFWIARYAARGWVQRRLAREPRFEAIDRAIAESGLKITFLLRLSPLFPFSLLNYALGLTRVRLRDFWLASFGMLPGTLLYVYYGKLAGDVAATAAGAQTGGAAEFALQAVGLAATLGATVAITRVARRALLEATGETPPGDQESDR